jgi:hypothetical protein
MTDTIEELEQRRTSLYQQMQALGDFRARHHLGELP